MCAQKRRDEVERCKQICHFLTLTSDHNEACKHFILNSNNCFFIIIFDYFFMQKKKKTLNNFLDKLHLCLQSRSKVFSAEYFTGWNS